MADKEQPGAGGDGTDGSADVEYFLPQQGGYQRVSRREETPDDATTPSPDDGGSKPADVPAGTTVPPAAAGGEAARPRESETRGRGSKPPRRYNGNTAEAHAEVLAEAILDAFVGILRSRVARKGGHLSDADVGEMEAEFRDHLDDMKQVFVRALRSYAKAQEGQRSHRARANHFQRLIVHKFEHLLTEGPEVHRRANALSRRMLPGFFMAVSMMIGPEDLSKYEARAKQVVDRLRGQVDDRRVWDHVYTDPEARQLVIRAEIIMARHFAAFEKRLDWLVAMIDSHMVPVSRDHPAAGWHLTERHARTMLSALFGDLKAALRNVPTRQKMAVQYGDDTVRTLSRVITNLE